MRAVDRFIAILEAVADELDPTSATGVARRIDLPVSTTARLMAELEETGLLERADGRGRYVVGPRLRSLARAALHDPMLAEQAQSVLDGLRDRSGETVSLHVRREGWRVCIAHAESHHSVRRVVPIGATVPLHVGATGAMLLADLPRNELDAYLTTAGMDDGEREALEARLAAARRDGWSCTVDVVEPGLSGVAASIAGRSGVIASMSISGPTTRLTAALMHELAPHVLAAAAEISRRAASISE